MENFSEKPSSPSVQKSPALDSFTTYIAVRIREKKKKKRAARVKHCRKAERVARATDTYLREGRLRVSHMRSRMTWRVYVACALVCVDVVHRRSASEKRPRETRDVPKKSEKEFEPRKVDSEKYIVSL